MAGKGSAPGERRGGREKGTPNTLPDLRALTLKALMQAGGADYLARQADENPGPFLGLLGRVMPREVHTELTGELRIRQEVRKELVEKLVILLATGSEAVTVEHAPTLMLHAQAASDRESLSRRAENARREALGAVAGAVQRAAASQSDRLTDGASSAQR